MDSDKTFNGHRACPMGMPSQIHYRIRGNKLHPASGGPAAFEIRGSRIYRTGNPSRPVYDIRGTSVCDCRTSQPVYALR